MPLYNRLKEYRARLGVNQQEMGRLAGVSRQTISQIERGDYSPSVTLALKLAKLCQVSVEDIFSYEEDVRNEAKSENQKAFPRFLGILVVASLIGGVLGGLSGVAGYFWKDHTAFGAAFAHLLGAASPWAMVACAAVLLGLGLYQYRKSDTAFHGWDGEDEDVMQRAEERLS